MTRKTPGKTLRSLLTLLALTALLALPIQAQSGPVTIESYGEGLYFSTDLAADGLYLQVRGPAGFRHSENTPGLGLLFEPGRGAPDGLYHFELVVRPLLPPVALAALEQARSTGDRQAIERLRAEGEWVEIEPVSGTFRLEYGSIVGVVNDVEEEAVEERSTEIAEETGTEINGWQESATKDQVVADDLIVAGSACIGDDCTNGIGFSEDTLRLKEFNTRIHFEDISGGTYPTNDWRLKANSTSSGGANFFGLVDVDAGKTPFRVDAGAPTNALRVDDSGNVGFGTSTPAETLHATSGDTPTLRLDQNASGGGTPQAWDVRGNETAFSIGDATGGTTPFEVQTGAPNQALVVSSSGRIGFGTPNPVWNLHVTDPNDPTLRLEQTNNGRLWDLGGTSTDFFVRDTVSNNAVPFRVWAGAGEGALQVRPNGEVRIGEPGGIHMFTDGKLGIQTGSPQAPIHVARDGGVLGDQATEELAILENDAGMHLSFVRTGTVVDWQVGVKDHNNFFVQVPFAAPLPQLELNPGGLLSISGDLQYGADQESLIQVIDALEARIAALEAEMAGNP